MHSLSSNIQFVSRGGFMMIPLLASAFLALTVMVERAFVFRKRYAMPPNLLREVLRRVEEGKPAEATAALRDVPAPVASVLRRGLGSLDLQPAELELVMRNEAERWVPLLEKRVEILDTIITAAPLMGLLGTITGMMNSFRVLSTQGVNEPSAITGGVAEALIATATGLVIALICLVAYNALTAHVKRVVAELESSANHVSELKVRLGRRS